MTVVDYYEILGVEPTADNAQVASAYRKMALKYHPDKSKDDPEAAVRFAGINEAYRLLLDENARAAFDRVRVMTRAAIARQQQYDEKRRALRRELLNREEAYLREREEHERREAERKLHLELARLNAEAEIDKRREQQAGQSGEECTLRFSILGRKIDLRSLFPSAEIRPNRDDMSGLMVFPDAYTSKQAFNSNVPGLVLEWIKEPNAMPTKGPGGGSFPMYESMRESDLEQFTLNRLRQMASSSPSNPDSNAV